jgi:hypothetical protein
MAAAVITYCPRDRTGTGSVLSVGAGLAGGDGGVTSLVDTTLA